MDLHLKFGCWLIIFVIILVTPPLPPIDPFIMFTAFYKDMDTLLHQNGIHDWSCVFPSALIICQMFLLILWPFPLMNSCHRIHHSGIYAVFSFIHLLLVLVIRFDTLFLACLLSQTLLGSLSISWSSYTHASSLLHNWLIMLLGPVHTHKVTPWSVYTDLNRSEWLAFFGSP